MGVTRKTGLEGRKGKRKTSLLLRVLLWAALLLVLLTVAAFYLLEPARLGAAAQRAFQSALGVEVLIEKTHLDFYQGIGISFEGVTIPGRPGLSTPIHVEEVFLGLELAPLLNRQLVWKGIRFYKPITSVKRKPDGQWLLPVAPVKDHGKGSSADVVGALGAAGFFVKKASVQNGTVQFLDEARPGGALKLMVRKIQLEARNLAFDRTMQLLMSAVVDQPTDTAQIALEAEIHLPEEMNIKKIRIDGRLKAKDIWGDLFFPYYARYVPMKHIGGRVAVDGTYRGNLAGIFRTVSRVVVEHAVFDYPDAFEQRLTAPRLEVDTDVSLDGKDLIIGPTVVRFPEGAVNARCSLFDVIGPEKLRIDASAYTGTFRLEKVRKYIPTPIVPPNVTRFIRSVRGHGTMRIVSGGTKGIVKNYPRMDRPEHSGMVWAHAALEGVDLEFPGMPKMSGVRGDLRLKSGNLKASTIQLDALGGRWTINGALNHLHSQPELALEMEGGADLAVAYEFARTIRSPAFARLQEHIGGVRGRSQQKLLIRGPLTRSGSLEVLSDVQLEGVSLEAHPLPYPITNGSGTLHFDKQKISWAGINGFINQSQFHTKGTITNYTAENPLIDARMEIQLDGRDIEPFIKSGVSEDLMLDGALKATLHAQGSCNLLSVAGKIVMDNTNISFLPWVEKPLGVSSSFELQGSLSQRKELCAERLQFRIADTLVAGSGCILLDKIPRVDVNLPSIIIDLASLAPVIPTAGRFQPSGRITGRLAYSDWLNGRQDFVFNGVMVPQDVSVQFPGINSPVTSLNGRISLLGDVLGFHRVSARVGGSDLLVDGTVQGHGFSRVRLSFRSSRFNVDDFAPPKKRDITPPTAPLKTPDFLRNLEGESHISINNLHVHQNELHDLDMRLKIHKGILNIQKGSFGLGKGSFLIDATANLMEAPGQSFKFDMKVRDMDIAKTLELLGGKGEFMTGTLNMDGSVQGIWGGPHPCADTLGGKISMDIRRGLIWKHALLSRLFSLLNVSQLFGGRFPDLTTRGLPFHRITADSVLSNGVLQTDNFLLDGDAMKIVAAGNIDLGRDTIDVKMGVQPLLSVDIILNKLPIIGRILTGPNKGFIVLYYLVKGSLRNPKMTPIPIQSVGEGVVGIFGRLLNTPVDMLKKLDKLLRKKRM